MSDQDFDSSPNAAVEPTLADRIQVLTDKFDATFERSGTNGSGVRLTLNLANGDRFSGNGADTEAAVADLESRASTWSA